MYIVRIYPFINFLIIKKICKNTWGRQIRYISPNKRNVHACAIFLPLISVLTSEPPVRWGGITTGSLAPGKGMQ